MLSTSMATQPANDAPADSILPIPVEDLEMVSLHQPAPAKVSQPSDPYLVAFETPFDPGHPLDWPSGRKWAVTDVLSATGFNRIMVSTIMAPALSTIAREFDMNSAEAVMALSIYLLATTFGPLFIGPLSEMYGRRTILHASNIWFLIWNIVCGFANSKEVLIAARFLAGFGASSIYALAGGVLSDVWRPEQRGKSLGMYLLIPLLGAAVGMDDSSWHVEVCTNQHRADHRRLHGLSNNLALDVLVYFHFSVLHDHRFVPHFSRDLRASHLEPPCQEAQT